MSEQYENGLHKNEAEKKQKVLVVGSSWDRFRGSFLGNTNHWQYELCPDTATALFKMSDEDYDAILIEKGFFQEIYDRSKLSEKRSILENLPAGLALVDHDQRIIWCNHRFKEWCVGEDSPTGQRFFAPLKRPEMKGPDYYPFSKIRKTGLPSSTLLVQENPTRYLQMDAAPVYDEDGNMKSIVVELHDVTAQKIKEQKWFRLREAGKALAELSEKDILSRSPEERVEILKAKITKYAQEILKFATIEIRLISTKIPGLLEPLLAIGMAEAAKQRTLFVKQEGNGITGWVAFHGRSYKMDDPSEDAFYLEGIPGAQSSITVPLLYGGNVIGTFNVESRQKRAFTDDDMPLLESFAEYVAQAIHTLDLLSVEQIDSTFKSIKSLYSESISPLNQILLEAARLQQSDVDDRNELFASLARIQQSVREVQSVFQRHGAEIATELPQEVSAIDCSKHPALRDKRILLVDSDKSVGLEATRLLFYYGCTVETASNGENALKMASTADYDAYISAIKLDDMSAFSFFKRIRCIYCRKLCKQPVFPDCIPPEEDPCCHVTENPFVPFIYMRAFGYDSGHVTTRAAEAGVVKPIFQPFILTQLLETLEMVIAKAEAQKISCENKVV